MMEKYNLGFHEKRMLKILKNDILEIEKRGTISESDIDAMIVTLNSIRPENQQGNKQHTTIMQCGGVQLPTCLFEKIKEQVYDIQLDEEMAFDGMPEGLQSSERGESSEEVIDLLDFACDGLGEVLGYLNDIEQYDF